MKGQTEAARTKANLKYQKITWFYKRAEKCRQDIATLQGVRG